MTTTNSIFFPTKVTTLLSSRNADRLLAVWILLATFLIITIVVLMRKRTLARRVRASESIPLSDMISSSSEISLVLYEYEARDDGFREVDLIAVGSEEQNNGIDTGDDGVEQNSGDYVTDNDIIGNDDENDCIVPAWLFT